MGLPRVKRLSILFRDDFRCLYCRRHFPLSELTVDHLHPVVKGGTDKPRNLVASCSPCNTKKGSRPWTEFRKRLQKEVKRRRGVNLLKIHQIVESLFFLYGEDTIDILESLSKQIQQSPRWS